MKIKKLLILLLVIVMSCTLFTGCRKPYDKPEFVTIEASQTAFLIPLAGDTTTQSAFESGIKPGAVKMAIEILQKEDNPYGEVL